MSEEEDVYRGIMPRFGITMRQVYHVYYELEAENLEEAESAIFSGDCDASSFDRIDCDVIESEEIL